MYNDFQTCSVTIAAVDKQLVLHIPIVSVCSLGTQHEMRMCHIVICGLSGSTIFSHITS